MSDQKPEIFFNGQRVESEEELGKLMMAAQEAVIEETARIMEQHNVSAETADAINYLRSRSRWTPEKELELITRDRAGNPIPLSDVLSGEF